jgi:predicted  nucleic acid-binding Zn-ribbon protein
MSRPNRCWNCGKVFDNPSPQGAAMAMENHTRHQSNPLSDCGRNRYTYHLIDGVKGVRNIHDKRISKAEYKRRIQKVKV